MALSKDWDRESADLFIHTSGARITRASYRGKLAWWYFPASLDAPAVEHASTDEGREEAFATSAKELPKSKPKRKAKPGPDKKGPKARKGEEDEASHRTKGPDANPDEEEAEEEDKDENGE